MVTLVGPCFYSSIDSKITNFRRLSKLNVHLLYVGKKKLDDRYVQH